MSDKVRTAVYYKVEVPHKAGQGARLLSALKEAGVNLLAFNGFPISPDKGQLDFVPENPDAFVKAMKGLDVKLGEPKSCFLIQGDDRVGALSETLSKLATQGITVVAGQAVSAGEHRFGMILWVNPADQAKTAKALGA